MKVEAKRQGEVVILAPQGRLDSETSPSVEERLQAELGAGRRRLLLDLSGVTYLSSRGLRAILATAKAAREAGGRLAVCSPQEAVRKIIDMTGVASLIELQDSCEQAVRSLESNSGA